MLSYYNLRATRFVSLEAPGQMSGSKPDARKSERIPIELRVDYPQLNSFFADYARNISKGGTFIRTDRPLPPGTLFHFRLTVPKRDEPFALLGEVIWSRKDGDEPGMGIRFVYRSEEEKMRLEQLVEALMRENLGPELSERLLRKSAS